MTTTYEWAGVTHDGEYTSDVVCLTREAVTSRLHEAVGGHWHRWEMRRVSDSRLIARITTPREEK